MRGPAPVVEGGQVVGDRLGDAGGEAVLVHAARPAPLGAGPVVGEEQDQGVVEQPPGLEEGDQPADLRVGVGEEAGEDLLLAGVHPALVVGERRPLVDPRGPGGQHGALGHDAGGHLAGEGLLAPVVPAAVVAAAVGGDPFGGHVVGGVHGPGGEVEEEGLPRRGLLLVQDVADGGRGQVLAQVVTVLRAARRVDVVVVADQVGRPVVGVALEEAVVALEPHPERPAVEGAGGRPLPARREVPLADGQGAVAGVAQQAGEGRRALGQPGGVAGVAHRQVGQKAHPHRVVVASGEERGPGRRAQGGHVEAVVAQPAVGQAVDVRRGDVRAEAPQLGEAGVVEDDGHHVRGTRGRLGLGGMDGRRLRDGEAESSVGGHRAPPSVGLEGEGGRLGTGPGYVERTRRLTPGAGPPPRRRA